MGGSQKRAVQDVRSTSLCLDLAIPDQLDRERPQLADDVGESLDGLPGTHHQRTVQSESGDGIGRLEFPVREMALNELVAMRDPVDMGQQLCLVSGRGGAVLK